MIKNLIEDKHRTWLKEHMNLTFEEVDSMTEEADDKFCHDLLMAECDALDDDSEDLSIINEIQDIVYGDRKPEEYEEEGVGKV